jgi:hypothetical protein
MCLSAVTVARWRGPRRRPRQSPPLVHVRVYRSYRYSHSGEFISSRQSDDDTVSPPLSSRASSRWGGRPWSFQPGVGSQPAERSRGAGRAEARRPKRGTWKGTAEENAPSKRTNTLTLCIRDARNACLDANITAHRVSQPLAPRAGTEATGCHDSYSRRNCCGSGSRRNRWRYGPWATALARYSVALQAARALSGVQHTC